MDHQEKYQALKKLLKGLKGVVLAYSGGVDSTLLLFAAKESLKEKVLAVTAVSPTYPAWEQKQAQKMAKELKVKHIFVETEELEDLNFCLNSSRRCYFCKTSLFKKLKEIAQKQKDFHIIEGTNIDDMKDFRPGIEAAKEWGVKSPLCEVKLTKKEIRLLSKELKLSTWNKPAFACLASRIPYGEKITPKRLERIEKAERYLYSLGITCLRVRDHGPIARIEVEKENFPYFLEKKFQSQVLSKLKKLGYVYITLDLEGYQSGSMNKMLNLDSQT